MDKQYYMTEFKKAEAISYQAEMHEKLASLKISLQALVREVRAMDIKNAEFEVEWIKNSYNYRDAVALLDALDQHEWDLHVRLMEKEFYYNKDA